ncbi:MAG: tRNA pseudouridine(55) synthase TruB [Saprospiraceae bacterium]
MDIDQILNKGTQTLSQPFLSGCLILVDKPLEWTSFDVVNKIRFAIKHKFGVKKCKVGHAGTLDPLATGLLLICTGLYTKKIDSLQNESKVYSGTIKLGATTPTYDAESIPVDFKVVPEINAELLKKVEQNFFGTQNQKPPIYSAIKMKGQKSYDLARRGIEVEMKERPITIHDISLTHKTNELLQFSIHCSKGTYIRSLAHDIGAYLGCGGYLLSLRRDSISQYDVNDALSIDEVISNIQSIPSS